MNTYRHLHIDATFKVVPSLYYQLLTIMIEKESYCFPCLYVLMTRKTTALYTAIFHKLRELVPGFVPTSIMSDYEDALAIALRRVFGGDIQLSGCFFHYTQAVLRKFKKMPISLEVRRHEHIQHILHCLMSLPLLPPEQIKEGLADVSNFASHLPDDLQLHAAR